MCITTMLQLGSSRAARRKSSCRVALSSVLLMAAIASFAEAQTPTFFARADYAGGLAYAMVLADFNGDGILDIACVDGGQPQVLLGKGDGTFSPGPSSSGLGPSNINLTAGDLNGDGKVDLVLSDGTGSVQIGFGNGDGTFQPGPVLTDLGAYSITIADVNEDGLPDILLSSPSGLLVFLNQGSGAFGSYNTLLSGSTVYATVVGDVNGDGIADIVAGTGKGAQVLLGTGGGSFQNGQALHLQNAAGSMILADVNGDGKLDLAVTAGAPVLCPSWTKVSVLLGNGDGTFSAHANVSIPEGAYGVQVGDINGDGRPDLVILQNSAYPVSVAFNLGGGTFARPISYPAASLAGGFGIGPLRKPGLTDIVVAGYFLCPFVSVLLNEGKGTFEDGIRIPMSTPPGPFAAADFNDDGLTDLAVLTSTGVSIYQNSGKGYGPFTVVGTYTLTSPSFIVTADFNKDGHPDLAVSLSGGGIAILLGQGNGQFAAPVTLSSGAVSMIALGDFNEDGNVDIVATSNQIFFGKGDGTFAAPQPLLAGTFFTNNTLAWLTPVYGNLKNNRYLDLAVLAKSYAYDHFYTLINNGKGAFHLGAVNGDYELAPAELAVADFNGDGLPDLLLSGGVYEYVMLGNGDGTFKYGTPVVSTLSGSNIMTGDFNGDGKADFAATTGGNIGVTLGNGDGTFQNPFFVGTDPGTGFLQYVELEKTPTGRQFGFVTSTGDGIDISLQLTK